MLIFTLCLTNS